MELVLIPEPPSSDTLTFTGMPFSPLFHQPTGVKSWNDIPCRSTPMLMLKARDCPSRSWTSHSSKVIPSPSFMLLNNSQPIGSFESSYLSIASHSLPGPEPAPDILNRMESVSIPHPLSSMSISMTMTSTENHVPFSGYSPKRTGGVASTLSEILYAPSPYDLLWISTNRIEILKGPSVPGDCVPTIWAFESSKVMFMVAKPSKTSRENASGGGWTSVVPS